MRVHSINYTNLPVNCRAQTTTNHANKETTINPLQEGLNTAGAWFGFDLDFVSRRCNFFKSPTKNPLAINGIIGVAEGLVIGVYTMNKNK